MCRDSEKYYFPKAASAEGGRRVTLARDTWTETLRTETLSKMLGQPRRGAPLFLAHTTLSMLPR